ncbi:MAG: hypothetical protein AB7K52_09165 [Phycisphaerales bacterium]
MLLTRRTVWALTFSLAFLAAATSRADLPNVRLVLDEMERAVLAGDAEAYLAHVAADDPIFHREQQMWAADLKRHRPVEFMLTVSEEEPAGSAEPEAPKDAAKPGDAREGDAPARSVFAPAFGPERATFMLKMSWRMGDDVDEPGRKLREVKYPVEFVRTDGRWLYRGELWDAVERPADETTGFHGVRVRFPLDSGLDAPAKLAADLMPGIRSRVDELFGLKITRVQEVKLYSSMLHLQASIYLSYTDGLGGWNEPHESVKILSRGRTREAQLKNLLGHEYGHVATFELMPDSDQQPWWLLEGLADFAAGHVTTSDPAGPSGGEGRGANRRVLAWHKAGKLAEWNQMADFRKTPNELMGHVYKQGEHFVRWFSRTFGDAARNTWVRLLGSGKTLDEASVAVTAKTFAELDTAWRESVGKLAQEQKPDGEE